MLNKPRHSMSYAGFITYLINNGYIPEGSTKVSQSFIDEQIKLIKEKKSPLSSSVRSIIQALGDVKPASIITTAEGNNA